MQDNNEWFTWLFILKEKLQKEACKRRDRELITKEVLQIKKAKNCAHTKQAMTYLAWSTGPWQAQIFMERSLRKSR